MGADAIVPWPVFTEVDLFLRRRRRPDTARRFAYSLLNGRPTLDVPSDDELSLAIALLDRYQSLGIDLPDATVLAVAFSRDIPVFTWDFRHFRAVVSPTGAVARLLVDETQAGA